MDQESLQSNYWNKIAHKIAYLKMTSLAEQEIKGFFNFAGLKKGMKILDVGCGAGHLTLPLLRMGYEVTGTEISAKSLKYLYFLAKQENLSHKLVLKKTNFEEAIFEEEFDLVFCLGVIHHFNPSKKERIMANIVRSLKPGGKIVIFEPNAYYPLYLPWYLLLELVAGRRGIWRAEKGIFKSTLKGLKKILLRLKIKNIEIKRHTIIPLRLGVILKSVDKINEVLIKMPVLKNLSAYIWLKGNK